MAEAGFVPFVPKRLAPVRPAVLREPERHHEDLAIEGGAASPRRIRVAWERLKLLQGRRSSNRAAADGKSSEEIELRGPPPSGLESLSETASGERYGFDSNPWAGMDEEQARLAAIREEAIRLATMACAAALRDTAKRHPSVIERFVDDALQAAGIRDRTDVEIVRSRPLPGDVEIRTGHAAVEGHVDRRADLLVRAAAARA